MKKRVSILILIKSGDIHSITTVSSPCIIALSCSTGSRINNFSLLNIDS